MFGKQYFNIFTVLILLTLVAHACTSQTGNTKNITKRINELFPGAEIIEKEIKTGYTEVELLCNGEIMEAGFTDDNELFYTEKEIKIPGKVMDNIEKKLNKKYKGWSFDESLLVETPDTSFYKVEMLKNGVEENVYFTLEGKYYKPYKITPDENWNVTTLFEAYRNNPAPYPFLQPDKIYEMPEVLREISGITLASEKIMFCVQDELGVIFQYNLAREEISDITRFEDSGDFEDVTTDGTHAYVLRSDGTIFTFNLKNFDGKINPTIAPANCTNIEGLFFDSEKKQLYMACKSRPVNTNKEIRLVYKMDPGKIHETKVLFAIDVEEINKMLEKKYPAIVSGSSLFRFNPAAIAVHPISGEKYVLSASDRMLAVFGENGLKDIFPLPADVYYKPEGLAFSKNGDLYISSEGIKKGTLNGRIMLLRRQK